DRIAVMNKGRIDQLGTPREIYNSPATPAVAEFIGTNSFLDGQVGAAADGERINISIDDDVTIMAQAPKPIAPGSKVTVAMRPERITLLRDSEMSPDGDGQVLKARVTGCTYLGASIQYDID